MTQYQRVQGMISLSMALWNPSGWLIDVEGWNPITALHLLGIIGMIPRISWNLWFRLLCLPPEMGGLGPCTGKCIILLSTTGFIAILGNMIGICFTCPYVLLVLGTMMSPEVSLRKHHQWTSSLLASHANPFQQQDSGKGFMTAEEVSFSTSWVSCLAYERKPCKFDDMLSKSLAARLKKRRAINRWNIVLGLAVRSLGFNEVLHIILDMSCLALSGNDAVWSFIFFAPNAWYR